jgi:hypothetical protein
MTLKFNKYAQLKAKDLISYFIQFFKESIVLL